MRHNVLGRDLRALCAPQESPPSQQLRAKREERGEKERGERDEEGAMTPPLGRTGRQRERGSLRPAHSEANDQHGTPTRFRGVVRDSNSGHQLVLLQGACALQLRSSRRWTAPAASVS